MYAIHASKPTKINVVAGVVLLLCVLAIIFLLEALWPREAQGDTTPSSSRGAVELGSSFLLREGGGTTGTRFTAGYCWGRYATDMVGAVCADGTVGWWTSEIGDKTPGLALLADGRIGLRFFFFKYVSIYAGGEALRLPPVAGGDAPGAVGAGGFAWGALTLPVGERVSLGLEGGTSFLVPLHLSGGSLEKEDLIFPIQVAFFALY